MRKFKRIIAVICAVVMVGSLCALPANAYVVHAEDKTTVEEPEVDAKAAEESVESQSEEVAVKLTSFSMGDDLNALSAPTSFKATVGVSAPEKCRINGVQLLFTNEKNAVKTWRKGFAGDVWYPGEVGDVAEVEVSLGKYFAKGKWELNNVSIEYSDYDGPVVQNIYYYNSRTKAFELHKSGDFATIIDSLDYQGAVDFTVAESFEENVAPKIRYIKQISTSKAYYYVGESIKFEIGYEENEDGSGINDIQIKYENENKNHLGYVFDRGEGKYVGIGSLNMEVTTYGWETGSYNLAGVLVRDYAGNRREYLWDNGKLIDEVTKEEIAIESEDFLTSFELKKDVKNPLITSFKFSSEEPLYVGDTVKGEIGYCEMDSGIQEISVSYDSNRGIAYNLNFTYNEPEEGKCIGEKTLEIESDKIQIYGKYKIDKIIVTDYAGKKEIYYAYLGHEEVPGELRSYNGEAVVIEDYEFGVMRDSINNAVVSDIEPMIYTGEPLTPEVTVTYNDETLVKDEDYTLEYSNNTDVGTAKVTIKGLGIYTGTVEKNFEILAPHEHDWKETGRKEPTCTTPGEKTFTCDCGENKTEEIPVTDHTFSEEWTEDIPPTCTEEGSKSHHCTGVGCDAKKDIIAIPALEHLYTITEMSKATLSEDGKIVVKCGRCGDVVSSKTIYYPKSISLSATSFTYNGKVQKPSVKVVGSNGKTISASGNYTVSYPSVKKDIGRYAVKVTFKGNYSGSKTLYFTVGPKNSSTVSTSLYGYDDVQVKWSKVSGASGYVIYYKKSTATSYTKLATAKSTATSYKKPNLADGVKYTFKVVAYKKVGSYNCYNAGKTSSIYTLKKLSTPRVAKSGTKVKVSWTNIAGESGYQISQSTTKTGTKIVSTYKTTSGKYKTVSATKGKYYYYKVRAYRTVGTKKIYGPWSTAVRYKR